MVLARSLPITMSGVLKVIDSRTSRTYKMQVVDNHVRGSDLAQIRGPGDMNEEGNLSDQKLRVFDPGYENTAIMRSGITVA